MALCAAGGFIAWRLVWMPRRAMQLVGMEGLWIWSGRACRLIQQPWLDCTQATGDASRSVLDLRRVTLNRYTGALNDATHQWSVSDSLHWQEAQDSVRQAMRARGARPITCENLDKFRAELTTYRARHPGRVAWTADEAWHFGVADVHLQAAGLPAVPTKRAYWHIEVTAYGDALPECRPVQYRLLTPAEWMAREREALAEELGF